MKKIQLMAIMIALSTVSFAQNAGELTIKGSKATTKEATPQQVIDTLKARFPNAEAVQYYQTSAATAKGWAVSSEDNLDEGANLDYYTLKFKRSDFLYYGLFKADGTLVKSEFQQNDVELPMAVQNALKQLAVDKNYTDYQIISKKYYKYEDYDKHKEFYQVSAVKKTDPTQMKTVTLDMTGKIVKEE